MTTFLKLVMAVAAAGAAVLLAVAAAARSLGGLRAQLLLTLVGLLVGAMLMHVQVQARARYAARLAGGTPWQARRLSKLLILGVAVIITSQAAFLILVWTNWRTAPIVWRLWWVSMTPSVFVTHLLLLRAASGGRWRHVDSATAVCVVWAGLMILYLGLRPDMLADIHPAYLWVGAVPAAGTVLGSTWLAVRWLLGVAGPAGTCLPSAGRQVGRYAAVAGILVSNVVVAVAGFLLGRATAGRSDPWAVAARAGGDIRRQVGDDVYAAQSHIAEFMGDTRIVKRPPFITVEQIEKLQVRLRPGDIILERRNWYLSNPCLPGFWPHSALYVGRIDDLIRLGVADHPAVRAHWTECQTLAPDGRPRTVIEAVSEGVILNSLTHSMHADYAAVLRPRLSDEQTATAVARAFEHLGKPYDFNFDFDDTGKLVCSQVICLAYQGMLDFPLKRILGRNTLPPVEIARKYALERPRAGRQLDFVLFLDAVAAEQRAREVDEEEFCASADRPREFVEK